MEELPIISKLKEDLKKVERELRVDIPLELRTAAAHGDLSENSEYDAAKERQSFLQARFMQLNDRINSLSSVKIENIPKDKVGFGSHISLEDINSGDMVKYELVTPEEVDPKIGKISISSPIGKALLNKTEGDEVSVNLPTGLKEYEITEFKTIHEVISTGSK
ncbi:MAG: transcription elongation factor GreA [Deltaproteobacteria bacterium]|nr:transcription elongation factor GreA [Deltaproteobacteria bacterium]